jgi:HKD family nuclease
LTGFLNETAALDAIRSMLSETDTATLAVAFWGTEAIERLGLNKSWKSLRIVCNLDSGACNPEEIERLMGLENVDVRTNWRLHGKVYLTPHALVMGSSNASSNGLVVEGAAAMGWAEANIQSKDPTLRKQLSEWCDARFSEALKIGPEQLSLAREAWNARKKYSPVRGGLTSNLMELVERQPDHPAFESIKVVQWARPASKNASKIFAEAVQSDGALVGTDIYEGWGTDMKIGDWLIDFDVSKQSPDFTGYWKVVHVDGENDVAFVRASEFIEVPTIGRLSASKAELSRLAEVMDRSHAVEKGPKERIASISDVVNALTIAPPP